MVPMALTLSSLRIISSVKDVQQRMIDGHDKRQRERDNRSHDQRTHQKERVPGLVVHGYTSQDGGHDEGNLCGLADVVRFCPDGQGGQGRDGAESRHDDQVVGEGLSSEEADGSNG